MMAYMHLSQIFVKINACTDYTFGFEIFYINDAIVIAS